VSALPPPVALPPAAAPAQRRRILFVGPLVHGCTSLQRCRAFQRQGHDVRAVDLLPPPWSRVHLTLPYRALNRLGGPYDLAGANRALRRDRGPAPDLVWVEKGLALAPGTLRALRRRWPDALWVNYSADDMFNPRNQSRQWRACLRLYDAHVTTKTHNVPELAAAGARAVVQVDKGFDPEVHRPMPVTPEVRERLGGDVGFVGWPEAERAASLLHLTRHGVSVRVWGPWGRPRASHPGLRVEGRPLWADEYASALSAFRVNLCFLRKANRDRHTARSIEIPACGGFMLAERTPEHQALFEEDREAVFFSDDAELLEKVRWYLAHEDERARIAEAGRRRCWSGGYTHEQRLAQVLGRLPWRGAAAARADGVAPDDAARRAAEG
jgi:spore maturation protein CgeB